MKQCDEMLEKTLQLADLMADMADRGDAMREDVGCGVLYGLLRDSAFKIRKMAEEEKEAHSRKAGAAAKRSRNRHREEGPDPGPANGINQLLIK